MITQSHIDQALDILSLGEPNRPWRPGISVMAEFKNAMLTADSYDARMRMLTRPDVFSCFTDTPPSLRNWTWTRSHIGSTPDGEFVLSKCSALPRQRPGELLVESVISSISKNGELKTSKAVSAASGKLDCSVIPYTFPQWRKVQLTIDSLPDLNRKVLSKKFKPARGPSENYFAAKVYAAFDKSLHHHQQVKTKNESVTTEHINAYIVDEIASRLDWQVVLGYAGGPSLVFLTDPTGAAEVFRLRDAPEGRSRRAALRNWVSSHWRQKRNNQNEAVRVRQHLRGCTQFTWSGLHCEIIPSAVDEAYNELLAIRRKTA